MKFICEVAEEFAILEEAKGGIKNLNGRMYPVSILGENNGKTFM